MFNFHFSYKKITKTDLGPKSESSLKRVAEDALGNGHVFHNYKHGTRELYRRCKKKKYDVETQANRAQVVKEQETVNEEVSV